MIHTDKVEISVHMNITINNMTLCVCVCVDRWVGGCGCVCGCVNLCLHNRELDKHTFWLSKIINLICTLWEWGWWREIVS